MASLSRGRAFWRSHPERLLVRTAVLIGATLVVLAPAFWNGFPFMFYDTGSFLEQAVRGGFVPGRSVFYAWFLAIFRPSLSLWPVIVAQALMTVLVMAAFARVVAPGWSPAVSPGRFLAMIAALCVGTSLPWYAGQVLPDIMAPLLVLSLYILGFHDHTLDRLRRVALIAVAVLAATSHVSHLGLAAGLAGGVALMQITTRGMVTDTARPRWRGPALVFALALAGVVAGNAARTGEIFVSRSGPGFILARLMQDGIVQRLLDDTCPDAGYRLCAYKNNLPKTANDYLWGRESPFRPMGSFRGTPGESRRIIAESLKRYPGLHLKMAALNTARQFARFATGDGIQPQHDELVPVLEKVAPRLLESYGAAHQQNGSLDFTRINGLHVTVGALSMAVLAAVLVAALRRRRWGDDIFLPMFVLTALLGNAFICGVLSNPHDRYQSRLIWAAGFAALLLMARRSRATASAAADSTARPLLLQTKQA